MISEAAKNFLLFPDRLISGIRMSSHWELTSLRFNALWRGRNPFDPRRIVKQQGFLRGQFQSKDPGSRPRPERNKRVRHA